jgi:hypothetical protein
MHETMEELLEAGFSMQSVPEAQKRTLEQLNLCDYITKLCRRQVEVILNHENPNVHAIGQGEPRHRKYKRLKLGGQSYERSIV